MELLTKGHILIVDDEDAIRFMLENQLFKEGYKVSIAANGLHALNKIKSSQKFDLIVCDLKMPGMSGIDFFSEVRKMGLDTPFLLITGYLHKKKIMEAVQRGVSGVMLKPLNTTEFMSKIAALLSPPKATNTPMAA